MLTSFVYVKSFISATYFYDCAFVFDIFDKWMPCYNNNFVASFKNVFFLYTYIVQNSETREYNINIKFYIKFCLQTTQIYIWWWFQLLNVAAALASPAFLHTNTTIKFIFSQLYSELRAHKIYTRPMKCISFVDLRFFDENFSWVRISWLLVLLHAHNCHCYKSWHVDLIRFQ